MSVSKSIYPPINPPKSGSIEDATYWTFDMVQERLVEAYGFLRRMPDREARWLRVATMSIWQQVSVTAGMTAVEQAEYRLYRAGEPPRMPGLTRDEVARMDEAMAWLGWVKPETRKVMAVALHQLWRGDSRIDWKATGADPRLSGSADRARMAYSRAITAIAVRLSSPVGL